ncbi:LPS-assembly protein LptD [Glaciimonas soli]|uniref:LPS-assembly protein LptD n=1 Tax=Glaciimonas soli TaxID=2590999 RepID=UPI002AD27D16|nr:LPS-assembly protein LptD [Glaciimonas soli]
MSTAIPFGMPSVALAQLAQDPSLPVLPVAPSGTPAIKSPRVDESTLPTTVQAEQMTGRPDRILHLDNDVDITRGQTNVTSNTATYQIIDNEVEAHGCVKMNRYGDVYTGDDLKLNMDTNKGFLNNATYKLAVGDGHGDAERVDFEDSDQAKVIVGTYTTCPGTKPDWYLKAKTFDIDTGLNEGVANSGIVYFKGVPILGAPVMSFPLSGERESGVLPPTYGSTNKGGLEIAIPYYFNIAPNRDLTITPNLITQRGLQLSAEARYMGTDYSGLTRIEFLPDDRLAAQEAADLKALNPAIPDNQLPKSDRYSFQSVQAMKLGSGFGLAWNVNYASDISYPDDFSRSITQSSQRLLNRELDLTYGGTYGSVTALASRYQVLQDYDAGQALISRPYDRLPQITYNKGWQDVDGFDFNLNGQYTKFRNSEYDGKAATLTNPGGGERVYINPQVSYPIIAPDYFLTPKLQVDATSYNLTNFVPITQPVTGVTAIPGTAQSFSRVLPTFSLDGGLIFERDATLFGNAVTQTLEPRMFYVRTPYHDQSNYPVFDSGLADFNFAQIFTENSFSGHDRISDANQLTSAITSRFIQANGIERLRLAIGQRFYFSQPLVSLNPPTTTPDTATTPISRSDLLLAAGGQITPTLGLDSNIQYSQSDNQVQRANYSMRWQPAPKEVINLAYRLDRTANALALNNNEILKQVDLSAQWPIYKRWYGVGRINYDLINRQIAEGLIGLEYKADCWVFRIVAQRIPTSTLQATSAIFFQLELNGLSKLGPNPMQALRSSIPGYQNVNSPDTMFNNGNN